MTGRPFSTSATETDQSVRPERYARVPSIGSTTQMRGAWMRARSSSVSSESQPHSGAIALSRARKKLSTAMSASLTGEPPCLVQFLTDVWNVRAASAPASRTASSTARFSSGTRNGQSFQPHGWRIGAVAEFEIVRRRERRENVVEMARDRDLTHRIHQFAVLDPQARGAAAVIAGDEIR